MSENPRILPNNLWPKRILEIPDVPKTLWIRGKLPDTNQKWLTVVGSRKNSSYGSDVCNSLIRELPRDNLVIVSGLAYGIDSIALEAAIDSGIKCVGIPGSGLSRNSISPLKSFELSEKNYFK